MSKVIYKIGDTQIKPGVKNPLIAIAYHICVVRPDLIVHIGDHHDYPSLSHYDKGKKSHRAKSYKADTEAGNKAFDEFFKILDTMWPEHENVCKKHFFKGNHEYRRERALEYGPDELLELMESIEPDYSRFDHVHEFLVPHVIEGVTFCHYFQNEKSATAIGTARQLLLKQHTSCVAGHSQGFDYAEQLTGNGKVIQALINGASYYHDEDYKKHNNHHFRGTVIMYNVKDGKFDFSRHSLESLDTIYTR